MKFKFLKYGLQEPKYTAHYILKKIKGFYNLDFKYSLNSVSLFLTLRCNLRCSMCPLWGEEKGHPELSQEVNSLNLTLSQWKEIIDAVSIYKPAILLTGGEPLLYPYWVDLVKYIKEKRLHSNLQTNGYYLQEYTEEITNYIDFLNISLDGPEKIHNKIRGNEQSFRRIIEGIKKLQEEKEKRKKIKPYINICYTLTLDNYNYGPELGQILEKERLKINEIIFQAEEFTSPLTDISTISQMVQEFDNLRTTSFPFNITLRPDTTAKDFKEYLLDPLSYSKKTFRKCPYPFHEIFIFPEGSVFTCPTAYVGNIKEEKPDEILNKIKLQKKEFITHGRIKEICKSCRGEIYLYQTVAERMKKERRE